MNLIPNSENMEPLTPPNFDGKNRIFRQEYRQDFLICLIKGKGYVKWVLSCEEYLGAMLLLKNYFTLRQQTKNSNKKSKESL